MQTAAPIGRVQKVNNARPVSLWVGRGCGRPRLRVAYDRYACDIRIPLSGGLAYQLQAALPLLFDHACWAQLTGNLDGTSFMCFPMVMNDFDNVAKFGLLPGDMISSVAEGHSEVSFQRSTSPLIVLLRAQYLGWMLLALRSDVRCIPTDQLMQDYSLLKSK
jgi:hypothetical protein